MKRLLWVWIWRWLLAGLALFLVGLKSGCATRVRGNDEAIWRPINALCCHRRAIVRYPSQVGAAAGGLAGIPLGVVALPITIPVTWLVPRDGQAALIPLAPVFMAAQGGAITTGGPFWLAFGWWGGPRDQPRAIPQRPNRADQRRLTRSSNAQARVNQRGLAGGVPRHLLHAADG